MSEIREKLIEEIYHELSAISWGFCRKDAKELIVRIGKAYADRELELPEIVGYYDDVQTPITFGQWAEDMFNDGARRFIALHEEEEK